MGELLAHLNALTHLVELLVNAKGPQEKEGEDDELKGHDSTQRDKEILHMNEHFASASASAGGHSNRPQHRFNFYRGSSFNKDKKLVIIPTRTVTLVVIAYNKISHRAFIKKCSKSLLI